MGAAAKPLESMIAFKVICLHPDLKATEKAVAAAIIDHFNRATGQCDPGIDRLATLLGIDRATVFRAIARLQKLGLVEHIPFGGKSRRNAYRPKWDRFRQLDDAWSATMKGEQPSQNCDPPQPAAHRAQRSQNCDPQPSQNCDLYRRRTATQTFSRNLSKGTFSLSEQDETLSLPDASEQPKGRSGQGVREPFADGQLHLTMAIAGGKKGRAASEAREAATCRWNTDLWRGGHRDAEALSALAGEREADEATAAELQHPGTGVAALRAACAALRAGTIPGQARAAGNGHAA